MKNNGGPAFPAIDFVVSGDLSDEGVRRLGYVRGMSLRDYFIAHAPQTPWDWYRPVVPPRPKAGRWVSADGTRFYATFLDAEKEEGDDCFCENENAMNQWDAELSRQYCIQWPVFWADAMLAERDK